MTESGKPLTEGDTSSATAVLERTEVDRPWQTVVWDDPVNLISYVTFVFRKLFGFSSAKAHQLTMQVHVEGKAVVTSGDRDKVEADVRRLQEAGLWATMSRDS